MRCAIEIQHGMVKRNADVPPEDRIEFRIGINVGDIIADDGDIFGTGAMSRHVSKPSLIVAASAFPVRC